MGITILVSRMDDIKNPLEPSSSLKRPLDDVVNKPLPQPILPEDSAVTKAEKVERSGQVAVNGSQHDITDLAEPAIKRVKLENGEAHAATPRIDARDKVKGVALIKEE